MLSLDHEKDDDHYTDFIDTLRFLLDGDESRISEIKEEFHRFRQALYGLDEQSSARAIEARDKLEDHLRSVIARTERIDMTRHTTQCWLSRPKQLRSAPLICGRPGSWIA
jgi:hypothetical protein